MSLWFKLFSVTEQITDVPNHRSLQHHLDSLDFPHRDSMNRFHYHLFKMMAEIHNFKMYIMRTNAWGIISANGTWNGAIGFMHRREVDLCMTPLRWSPERFGFYDATTGTYNVRYMSMCVAKRYITNLLESRISPILVLRL